GGQGDQRQGGDGRCDCQGDRAEGVVRPFPFILLHRATAGPQPAAQEVRMSLSDALNSMPSGDGYRRRVEVPPGDLFDQATGETHIPAGWNMATRGELVLTRTG